MRSNHTIKTALACAIASLLFASGSRVCADEIRAAVAANFAGAITELAHRFQAQSGHDVTLVFGSTGKHYAQITHGAPFDAFFAADARRPALLEEADRGLRGTRFTYATGTLVLWSPDPDLVDNAAAVLARGDFRHLAIANPKLAPYGRAAEQVLRGRGLWEALAGRIVRGQDVGQALGFVESGNAELGFVALSQVIDRGGSYWEVPDSLYDPIEQQAVLLSDNAAARAFLDFVRSDEARAVIRANGYGTP